MGLISAALGGAGEGLQKGANIGGTLAIRGNIEAEHQRLAQEAQAAREERNLRLTAQLAQEKEASQPRVVPAGSTLHTPGSPDFTAPTKETPEQAQERLAREKYYTAFANRLNADAEATRRGDKAKQEKPTLPKITPIKDDTGNTVGVLDENSGAFGVPTPGTPAQDAVSHWFKPDEPAKAAVPPGLQWFNAARQPIAGLHVYYPDMLKRQPSGTGAPATAPSATPDPLGLRAALPKSAPPLAPIIPGAISKPAPSAPQFTVDKYLGVARGGYQFQAPNRAPGVVKQLNGRLFKTKQEAQAAYDALFDQAE